MRVPRWLAAAVLLAAMGCREADGPLNPGGAGRVYVTSDPPGGRILVDNRSTGQVTPDTLRGIAGRRDITVRLDTFQAIYGFTARVVIEDDDSLLTITGPLVNRCSEPLCFGNQFRHYSVNRIRFAANPVGTFFLERGIGGRGILWPSVTNNSYASGSMVGFAGVLAGRDTVALGVYDNGYLAGRPTPSLDQSAERIQLGQTTWIVPPPTGVMRPTVRGIQISERLLATAAEDDIVVLRLVFRNITDQPLYTALDPTVPRGGLTYDQAYIGFLLDPDVGAANDDMLSYEPALDMAFAYDLRFSEDDFSGGFNRGPGLIGLRMIDAPAGARIILNGWIAQGVGSSDWFAGQASERNGWNMLSGARPYAPDHPDPRIGHLPRSSGDVRISVSAGPLRLTPGDSAAVTVAIVLAEPVPGSFNPGTPLEPGDPTDRTRALFTVAARLFERARAAAGVARSATDPGDPRR